MCSKPTVPFLRVVPNKPEARSVRKEDFATATWQSTLFASANPSLLIFIDFVNIHEGDLLAVLVSANLKYLFDLRMVPRFDVGTLNRKLVFSLFEKSGTQYLDISGRLVIADNRDARFNPELLASYLLDSIFRSGSIVDGPIGFLVDSDQFSDAYTQGLAQALLPIRSTGWEMLKIPYEPIQVSEASRIPASRKLIFISHANPEDNQFVLWLATHLAGNGYEVWSDLTKLFAGDEFWDNIEEAIRSHSAKVVVVLSKAAQVKKGVLDEIHCAITTERTQGIERFVLPLRIDSLAFSDVRANLARKNIINFYGNWALGLSQLLEVLERDRVPRQHRTGKENVASWYRSKLRPSPLPTAIEEQVVSNWIPILDYPAEILFHDVDVPIVQAEKIFSRLPFPAARYLRLTVSFADALVLSKDTSLSANYAEKYRVRLDDFLRGAARDVPGIRAAEARNYCSNLFRQAWERFASQRGLLPYTTASGAVGWYLPTGLVEGNKVTFVDALGKRRRKNLVGWSERRKVYWHLAIELKPVVTHPSRMVARAHVVFTSDGRTPIESKDRMHSMRRRFCKSWWNDRWRDLLLAYMNWLAADSESIGIPLGEGAFLTIARAPLLMISPVSIHEGDADEPNPDVVTDELDLEGDDENDLAEDWGDDFLEPPGGQSET